MQKPVRLFISHSSADDALVAAVERELRKSSRVQVLVDRTDLVKGEAWRRQLHQWMARCDAALVLLTPAVLAQPEWVLKEAIILGWRRDLDPDFALFYAMAPGVTRDHLRAKNFDLAQVSETQFLTNDLADESRAEALTALLLAQLPPQPPPSPLDELTDEIKAQLLAADATGLRYPAIAEHLGLEAPGWHGDKVDQFADALASSLACGPEKYLALDRLIERLRVWGDRRTEFATLIAPYWIDAEAASRLLRRAAPADKDGADVRARAVTISGKEVPHFTAKMTVRRAFGVQESRYLFAEGVGLGGSSHFDDIKRELCRMAVEQGWVSAYARTPAAVMAELARDSTPIFLAVEVLPARQTLDDLRDQFPTLLLIAPTPPGSRDVSVEALLPAPPEPREKAEYKAWKGVRRAIENSGI